MSLLAVVPGVASGVTGLFGGGGPDAKKYAERSTNVSTAIALAQSGNIEAWYYLGAFGNVAGLPHQGTLKDSFLGSYGDEAPGWRSSSWGDAYAAIQKKAARAYEDLRPRYAANAQTLASAATSALGGGSGSTWLLWALGAAVVAYLIFRRKG